MNETPNTIISANSHPTARVWLNGEEVSERTHTASVPKECGVEGQGWVDAYVPSANGRGIETCGVCGQPKSQRLYGTVRWEMPAP